MARKLKEEGKLPLVKVLEPPGSAPGRGRAGGALGELKVEEVKRESGLSLALSSQDALRDLVSEGGFMKHSLRILEDHLLAVEQGEYRKFFRSRGRRVESYLVVPGSKMVDIRYEVREARETCETSVTRLDALLESGVEDEQKLGKLVGEASEQFRDLVALFPSSLVE